jgi:hypothetical protein
VSLHGVVVNVIKNMFHKVSSFGSTGDFGQEVSPVVVSLNVRESAFIHSNSLAACVVTD